jgi:hypothetical protein
MRPGENALSSQQMFCNAAKPALGKHPAMAADSRHLPVRAQLLR